MANMTMVVVMSQMVFNRKKLDVCVYLMSAVAVQMEVNREDKYFLDGEVSMFGTCRWRKVQMQR